MISVLESLQDGMEQVKRKDEEQEDQDEQNEFFKDNLNQVQDEFQFNMQVNWTHSQRPQSKNAFFVLFYFLFIQIMSKVYPSFV